MVCSDIEALPVYPLQSKNLSAPQTEALLRLKLYKHLTIKEADKGGCVVVFDNAHYKRFCLDILENKTWFQPIIFAAVDTFMVDFYGFANNAFHEGIISKVPWQYIRTLHPRIFTFYCLPKLHKLYRQFERQTHRFWFGQPYLGCQ